MCSLPQPWPLSSPCQLAWVNLPGSLNHGFTGHPNVEIVKGSLQRQDIKPYPGLIFWAGLLDSYQYI